MYGMINNHGTQDWQVEAYERQDKTNPFIRHQRAINDVENTTYYSGINMSKRGRTYGK
jgi:hypothetical protein